MTTPVASPETAPHACQSQDPAQVLVLRTPAAEVDAGATETEAETATELELAKAVVATVLVLVVGEGYPVTVESGTVVVTTLVLVVSTALPAEVTVRLSPSSRSSPPLPRRSDSPPGNSEPPRRTTQS